MKKYLPILLSFLVLFQSMAGTLLVVNYQIQKQQIAKTLCENRNKPNNGCAGKCYLKKQLKKVEDAEKTLPGSIKEKMEVAYTMLETFHFSFLKPTITPEHFSQYFFSLVESSPFFEPHPPQV